MGQFQFDVPEVAADFFEHSLWQDAYICGVEGVPWLSRNSFDGERLTITRALDASGKLYLACPLQELGYRTLSTCSLRSLDDEPYLLPLELARGSCFRARVQSDAWQRAGMTLTPEFDQLLAEGTNKFLDAAQHRDDANLAAEESLEAMILLERAIADLGDSYAMQSIAYRKRGEPQIGTLLAATVVPPSISDPNSDENFVSAFNAAAVRLSWAEIENDSGQFEYESAEATIRNCANRGIRVIGGPLIDLRERLMPPWVYLMEDDFEAMFQAVMNFVGKTVARFRGSVQLWNCASGLNTPGPIALNDEQVMRLAVGILQTVRQTDPNTPAIMSFDQPFGEYLTRHSDGISPLHFADALIRSGLGMAGIGLEFRVNYQTNATLPRSAVDFGQMIDRWASFGLPMLVQLVAPGGEGDDPAAIAPAPVLPSRRTNIDAGSEQLQAVSPLIRTLLAKHVVHGIVWDGWSDAEPHVLSHSGLVDAEGKSRPLLDYLTKLRTDFLV